MGKATGSQAESDFEESTMETASPVTGSDKSSRKMGARPMSDFDSTPASSTPEIGAKRSFFEIYKPGQGYYTRMATAIGAGMLILGAFNFIYNRLKGVLPDASWTLWVILPVPAVIVAGLGLVAFYFIGVNRTSCDFLIATEGEMKKVSWSSRNELIGSTKVVIAVTFFLGALLFAVDYGFIWFFRLIGVLRSGM